MKTLTDILAEAIRTGLDAQRDADDFGYWDIDDNCIEDEIEAMNVAGTTSKPSRGWRFWRRRTP